MTRLLIALCLTQSLVTLHPCPAQEKPAADKKLPLVILFGDSIRINYQQAVGESLTNQATLWSPKENCKHTLYTLQNLEKWLTDQNPDVVHINAGLHDMFLTSKGGKPRHDIEFYEANLRNIFAQLKHLTDARIIFALTTPVDESRQATSNYGRVVRRTSDVLKYNQAARRVALAHGVIVNDLHTAILKAGKEDILKEDGIHLSKKGQEVVGALVAQSITTQLAPSQDASPKNVLRVGNVSVTELLKRLGAEMEHGMPASELSYYGTQFQIDDHNRDGKQTRQEYIDRGRYLTPRARQGIFQAADSNGDGVVTKDEFILNRIITDEAKRIISKMDDDGDGYVEEPEFTSHASRLLGDAKLAAACYAAFDRNRDGELLTFEYLRLWGQWARSGQPSASERIAARRAALASPLTPAPKKK